MSGLIGRRLGQYEIVAVLGQGGMATVYRARQVSVNREVAVKVIQPDLALSPDFAARFSREAQTIANLSHPHVLKLFDFGQEGDILYLVTELLPGGTLADLMRQGPIPLQRADHLLDQIASALDYAHQQDIIHRDLKPQNIILDSHGNAFLTDFGLARPVQGNMSITQSGVALGTPAYMSPEAWKGEEIDSRSDLYALGIMLYEMLSGKLPFNSDSPYKLMMAHINETPPHVEALPDDISPQFDALIQQILAKEPADRPPSAQAIASAFHNAVIGGDNVTPAIIHLPTDTRTPASNATPHQSAAVPGSAEVAAPRKSGLNRAALAGIAVVVVLLVAAVAIFASRPGSTPPIPPTSAPAADVIKVDPVPDGDFMILVAQPEQLGKQPRDITRFIVSNLTETLDTSVPFSSLRIREYPKVITSAEQAKAAANANNALVIVWGTVSDTVIDLQVQVGALTAIPHSKMPENTLRRISDVHVQLTDPLTESLAIPILVIVNTMQSADGNVYEVFQDLSLLDQLKSTTTSASVSGNSTAAQLNRNEILFLNDTQKFVDQMDPIIALDSSNPVLYLYRSLGVFRLRQIDQALQDAETSKKLGPEGWTTPLYMPLVNAIANKNYEQGLVVADQLVKANPKDWYAWSIRGALNYFAGKMDSAKADLDQSFTLSPKSTFPYLLAIIVAIRQARIADGKALIDVLLNKFTDVTFTERAFNVAFGDPASSKIAAGVMISASANLFVGQYDKVITQIDHTLAIDSSVPDTYLLQGFAYCNLSKWAEAEKAYTVGLALDPNYAVLYALRAEVRNKQGNTFGALSDIQAMQKVKGSEELTAMVNDALKAGPSAANFGCQTIFSSTPATAAP